MVPSDEPSRLQHPPGWAVDRAAADLYDVDDPGAIAQRAWEFVHEAEQLEDERHNEYDEPVLLRSEAGPDLEAASNQRRHRRLPDTA